MNGVPQTAIEVTTWTEYNFKVLLLYFMLYCIIFIWQVCGLFDFNFKILIHQF